MHQRNPTLRWNLLFKSPVVRNLGLLMLAGCNAGCSGEQAALAPAGEEADAILNLLVVTVIGAAVIWILVIGLLLYAGRPTRRVYSEDKSRALILWGGVAFPATVLTLLLAYALWLMPQARPWFRGAADGTLRIEVTGEQFWWRVRYLSENDDVLFETANDIRLPVRRRIEFSLKATDVIHSFWIPALAGKMDMIPGRTNRLSMTATRPGVYRGPCAEFCGSSHALMVFSATVLDVDAFEAWMKAQQSLSRPDDTAGEAIFVRNGCPACHGVRQIGARGTAGPDLSNFGDRSTIGAGALVNTLENVTRFIRAPGLIKPDVHMPSFAMLPEADIEAMARYVRALR